MTTSNVERTTSRPFDRLGEAIVGTRGGREEIGWDRGCQEEAEPQPQVGGIYATYFRADDLVKGLNSSTSPLLIVLSPCASYFKPFFPRSLRPAFFSRRRTMADATQNTRRDYFPLVPPAEPLPDRVVPVQLCSRLSWPWKFWVQGTSVLCRRVLYAVLLPLESAFRLAPSP